MSYRVFRNVNIVYVCTLICLAGVLVYCMGFKPLMLPATLFIYALLFAYYPVHCVTYAKSPIAAVDLHNEANVHRDKHRKLKDMHSILGIFVTAALLCFILGILCIAMLMALQNYFSEIYAVIV